MEKALKEDAASNDLTTNLLVPGTIEGSASIISKGRGIISGQMPASAVFRLLSTEIDYRVVAPDGGRVEPGDVVSRIRGSFAAILSGERTALNFLGHLSGIATLTSRYVKKVSGSGVIILDTRKTTPGLRSLEKKAVLDGGGQNHRADLESYILVKENHILAAGGIERLPGLLGRRFSEAEIEVTSIEQLRLLRDNPPDRVMLDNFDPKTVRKALEELKSWEGTRPGIEVSGGIDLSSISTFVIKGVDFISVGSLTSAAGSLDLSLLAEEVQV